MCDSAKIQRTLPQCSAVPEPALCATEQNVFPAVKGLATQVHLFGFPPLWVRAPRCAEPTWAAYFSKAPESRGRFGALAVLLRSSALPTSRSKVPAAASILMRSPFFTIDKAPPTAASGET